MESGVKEALELGKKVGGAGCGSRLVEQARVW